MTQLMPTFPKGGRQLLNTKLVFVVIITVLYCLWFFLVDLLAFSLFSNFQGLHLPLYAIPEFKFTPLTLSILSFHLISCLLKTLGMCLFAVFIALASKISAKALYVFIAGLFPLIAYITWKAKPLAGFSFLDFVNPMTLIKNRYLFMAYKPMVIGNHLIQPVLIFSVTFFILLILTFLVFRKLKPLSFLAEIRS